MKKLIMLGGLLATTAMLSGCGVEVVDAGHRGVKKTLGKVSEEVLPEGMYFYNPFTSDIIEMTVQTLKFEGETEAYTKDVQQAKIKYTLTYSLNPSEAAHVYTNVGQIWSDKLILDLVPDALKNVIGSKEAVELVSKRGEVAPAVIASLKSRIAAKSVEAGMAADAVRITSFAMNDIQYQPAFEKAVEDKVTAVQRAEEEKNKTVQVQEQADQQVISAKATAESMRIRAEALSQNKALVEWEAVQKWDGVLPQYMLGGATPFINVTPKQ
jgi:regulator of protease activity HflC (stomatin/prohibitin superfamily)